MGEKGNTSSSSKGTAADDDGEVGQGELYSPAHAMKLSNKANPEAEKKQQSSSMVESSNIRRNFNLGAIKDRLLEKLAAASVPANALDNARHFLEGVVKDVTLTAQFLTKDALHKIRTHLVDILPSLPPSITKKMVDEAEKEANNGEHGRREDKSNDEGGDDEGHQSSSGSGKVPHASPASSLFSASRL